MQKDTDINNRLIKLGVKLKPSGGSNTTLSFNKGEIHLHLFALEKANNHFDGKIGAYLKSLVQKDMTGLSEFTDTSDNYSNDRDDEESLTATLIEKIDRQTQTLKRQESMIERLLDMVATKNQTQTAPTLDMNLLGGLASFLNSQSLAPPEATNPVNGLPDQSKFEDLDTAFE